MSRLIAIQFSQESQPGIKNAVVESNQVASLVAAGIPALGTALKSGV